MAATLVVGLVLGMLGHPAWPVPTVLDSEGVNTCTPEEEIRLGRNLFNMYIEYLSTVSEKPVREVNDPFILAYLYSIEGHLFPHIPARYGHPSYYPIRLVDMPEANSFAAMGGYLMFTVREVAEWRSDDQAMMAFGHEIGHVLLHHSARRMTRQKTVSKKALLLISLMAQEEEKPELDPIRARILTLLFWVVDFAGKLVDWYDREYEIDSDVFAVQLCWLAGCSPDDYILRHLNSTLKIEPSDPYPTSAARIKRMKYEMQTLRQERPWPYNSHRSREFLVARQRARELLKFASATP